jgi:nuclear transport factor 2 (NTF2) superfamily protein
MRPPLAPLAETNTTEKVHFAKDAWNNNYAVAGEPRRRRGA